MTRREALLHEQPDAWKTFTGEMMLQELDRIRKTVTTGMFADADALVDCRQSGWSVNALEESPRDRPQPARDATNRDRTAG